MPHIISKEQLIGAWTFKAHDADLAAISIGLDSIFYTSDMQSYSYQLKGNSFVINYPDGAFTGKVSFNNDTLILSDRDYGTIHYYRWK